MRDCYKVAIVDHNEMLARLAFEVLSKHIEAITIHYPSLSAAWDSVRQSHNKNLDLLIVDIPIDEFRESIDIIADLKKHLVIPIVLYTYNISKLCSSSTRLFDKIVNKGSDIQILVEESVNLIKEV